jgi:hypothetical protein
MGARHVGAAPDHRDGAQLLLASDAMPALKYEQSCRAAAQAAVMPNRNENACLQDEKAAKQKLADEWKEFTPAQKSHCVQLSSTGGFPSYVELLTCVEMSKGRQSARRQHRAPMNRSR